jgi:TonB-linked SusC/RagA family outer membrane protein
MRKTKISLVLMLLCAFQVLFAQKVITGTVTDAKDGSTLPGVSVVVQGTTIGTITGTNGEYKLSIPSSAKELVFSYIGYEKQTINVVGKQIINVSLTTSTVNLNEVTVVTTALGMKRQAKDLGYAATTIQSKFITQGKSLDVQQALNGKVSGVDVTTTNSGVFDNSKINIRGIRSLTGNNQPMLVVDGSPVNLGYLSSISPEDIEDITILKSAASASIYGPDAVNGVIVVTTKRGGSKKLRVDVTSTVQWSNVAFFPKYQKEFGGWGGEATDAYGNPTYIPIENQQYGPRFDGSIKQIGPVLQDGSFQSGPYTNAHYSDKVKFWSSGATLQNGVSFTGDDFYFSINNSKIRSVMPGDINQKTDLRFNAGKKYGNFSINYNVNYTLQNWNVVNEAALPNLFAASSSYNGSVFFAVMQTPSNVPLLQYKDWQNNKFAQYSNYYNDYALNPYWIIGNLRQLGTQHDVIGNVNASYKFADWLRFDAKLSSNMSFQTWENTTAPIVVSDWAHANRSSTQYTSNPGKVLNGAYEYYRINFDYFFSGEKAINDDFGFKYILGGMLRQNRSKDIELEGDNLVVPYLYNISVRSGDATVPAYTANADIQSRMVSTYGNIDLSFKKWLFLELTGRNDWDSRLLKSNRSFFYPGANVSFVVSDAIPSLKKSDNGISFLKVRAAMSKSGNVNLNPYALNATYSTTSGFPYGNIAGFSANGTIPDKNLKPEFVTTTEAGVEVGLLNNRIYFDATYFFQNCTNQILQISQSTTTGYPYGLANAASFENYGVEMDLNLNPVVKIGKGIISLKLNATYNNNKVTKTYNNTDVVVGGNSGFIQNSGSSPTVNNIAVVGQPAFQFQLTDYARDPSGHVIVDPTTGYPSESPNLVNIGRSLPLWIIGATPTFTLADFSFAMTWDFKGGNYFYAGMGSDEDFAGISARSAEYGRQRFVFPNSVYWNGTKYVPNTHILVEDGNSGFWTGGPTNTQIATNYFASAAALRLREVNITYTLPSSVIRNIKGLERVSISAVGRNLLLITPKSNQWGDPEFDYSATNNTYGISSSYQSPASRFFGGTLNVQF